MKRPVATPDFDTLLDQSMEELQLKTQAHDAAWHIGEADWSLDQEAGILVFTLPDGTTATCPAQIIGTFNLRDETWLWGWDHPSVAEPLQEHAQKMRAFGQQHGFEPLTMKKLGCSEEQAWELTALACKLCEAQGAYRGAADDTLVFMTFGEVRLQK
jgi:hypothetical protein